MLKHASYSATLAVNNQPPSGGCVLKPDYMKFGAVREIPAAFRRLCVETRYAPSRYLETVPAAFRRLCVETIGGSVTARDELPAA